MITKEYKVTCSQIFCGLFHREAANTEAEAKGKFRAKGWKLIKFTELTGISFRWACQRCCSAARLAEGDSDE